MNITIAKLKEALYFFNNSSSCLNEEDSFFSPEESLYTVAQQVAHVAITVDWFFEAISGNTGFDMNSAAHEIKVRNYVSLKLAQEHLNKSFHTLIAFIESKKPAYFNTLLPEGPVLGGQPKSAAFLAIIEHCAHHRGVLTVYSRLLDKTPLMPYEEF